MKTLLLASALAAFAASFAAATEPAPAFRDFDVRKEFAGCCCAPATARRATR